MATIVCRGLQSCLESQLVEPRTLRLRLSSPRVLPHFSEPLELTFKSCFLDSNTEPLEKKCHSEENPPQVSERNASNADLGSRCSFLEAISNGGQLESIRAEKDAENTYVHPLSRRSLSTLSDKSLELCTENLGSETGTDIIEDSIFSSSDSESGKFPTREQKKSSPRLLVTKKASNCRSFPPPLTTISGLESLRVRTHREDGRLIIKAVKAPSTHSIFKAERSHGRLRLSFFKDDLPLFDSEEPEREEEMATDETTLDDDDSTHQEFEILENKEEGAEEDENGGYSREEEEMGGNNLEVGGEMGRKKFQNPGRCKEAESGGGGGEKKNIRMLNWEPLWVATS